MWRLSEKQSVLTRLNLANVSLCREMTHSNAITQLIVLKSRLHREVDTMNQIECMLPVPMTDGDPTSNIVKWVKIALPEPKAV